MACSSQAPSIDTEIHGIELPAEAVVVHNETIEDRTAAGTLYEANLPDWEVEEVIEWMTDRLPVGETFDGMDYLEKESQMDESLFTQGWMWRGLSRTYECHFLMVGVADEDMGEPVKVMIADGTDVSSECEDPL